ncbi:hypothetical protein Fmac_021723 [Flemingia macrophylla]|uniref:Uncharacterized protein n=1 Tax=Flemingia macrophylla TaxID=520843 RepID=A0ABD1LXT4_9FABA
MDPSRSRSLSLIHCGMRLLLLFQTFAINFAHQLLSVTLCLQPNTGNLDAAIEQLLNVEKRDEARRLRSTINILVTTTYEEYVTASGDGDEALMLRYFNVDVGFSYTKVNVNLCGNVNA